MPKRGVRMSYYEVSLLLLLDEDDAELLLPGKEDKKNNLDWSDKEYSLKLGKVAASLIKKRIEELENDSKESNNTPISE